MRNNTCHAYPWKRKSAGFFMQKPRSAFDKAPLTLDQLIKLLESRGLLIKDSERAKRYLRYIDYFRLSRYFSPFKDRPSGAEFKPGATFDDILTVYIFDRKLRLLIIDAIERIEVAVRATISNTMSISYGSHWYCERGHFKRNFNHAQLINRIKMETGFENKKKRNESCRHYYENYNAPELPASWMIAEVLPIGSWSLIYEHLWPMKIQKVISREFGLNNTVMASWLLSLTYLRNLCAHHSRVWNRKFTITPIKAKKYSDVMKDNSHFYAQAIMIQVFLKAISTKPEWNVRLSQLFKEYSKINNALMGFPSNWDQHPLWN